MTYKKKIAGVGEVDMTPQEISERQAEEALWEVQKLEPKKPDLEARITALEQKVE